MLLPGVVRRQDRAAGQVDIIKHRGDLIQLQSADIFGSTMRQYLLDVPAPLKRIREVDPICACAPDNMYGRVYGGHV
jgi:hypothetical protein